MSRPFHAFCAATVALLSVLAAAPASAAETAAKAPMAVILFLDRTQLMREAAAAKSIYTQVEELTKKMETDFGPENRSLQGDISALQAQAASMSPDQRQARIKELEERRQAFQAKVKERQDAIQAGLADARDAIERALIPQLEEMMKERGANMLIDRSLVVWGATDLDITAAAIAKLDVALPTVKVAPRPPRK